VNERHLEALGALGIKAVVNLIQEAAPDPAFVAAAARDYGITVHYFPFPDREAPPPDVLDGILQLLSSSSTKTVVHCMGGVGRTNCVLAAYLMTKTCLSPSQALSTLEAQRKVLLTPPQRALLTARFGVAALPQCGPHTRDDAPAIILLAGLPGSGKSTFTHRLQAIPSLRFSVVSQDDHGKDAYKAHLVRWARDRAAVPHAVLDRCNLSREDRADAVAFAKAHHASIACVHLATDPATCIERIRTRTEHATVKSGASGKRIVEDMAPRLQEPHVREGFASVHVIAGPADVDALLERWFGLSGSSSASAGAGSAAVAAAAAAPGDDDDHHPDLRKFPRTRHLVDLGSATRDDLLFDKGEVAAFLKLPVRVEEKMDGANVGISIVDGQLAVQNRSHYVNEETSEQFKPLKAWLQAHSDELWTILQPSWVLYGEWLHLKHSIHYTRLPDRFMLYDIWDGGRGVFLDAAAIDALVAGTTLVRTRVMFQGPTTLKDLVALASSAPSAFYDGPVEGVYVRAEKDGAVTHRGKIVRTDFLERAGAGAEVVHWTAGKTVKNTVVVS
jgi:atypical dual specificity phosphatase